MTDQPSPTLDRRLTPWKGFIGVFFAVFIVVFAAGALITFMLPESYLAVARLITTEQAQVQAVQSDRTLLAAAEELRLRARLTEQYAESEPLTDKRLLESLRRSLRFKVGAKGGVVEVRAFGLSPRDATDLANAVAGKASAASGTVQGIRILELASPPNRPARPNKPLNLTIAALVGIVLGIMAGGVGARLAVGFDRTPRPEG